MQHQDYHVIYTRLFYGQEKIRKVWKICPLQSLICSTSWLEKLSCAYLFVFNLDSFIKMKKTDIRFLYMQKSCLKDSPFLFIETIWRYTAVRTLTIIISWLQNKSPVFNKKLTEKYYDCEMECTSQNNNNNTINLNII